MHSCAGNLALLLESDLLSSGWDPAFCGPRTPDESSFQYGCESLKKSLLSKFLTYEEQIERNSNRDVAALASFISCNNDCENWSYKPADDVIEVAVNEAKAVIDSFCHPEAGRGIRFTFWQIASKLGLGKGSNVGVTNVDYYSKAFCSTMTSTSIELPALYRLAISGHPVELSAEIAREHLMGTRIVTGSNVSFVPKKREISRIICTEPTAEMHWQKGIGAVFEDGLTQVFGIDLSRQPDKNRALARIGSLTDEFATIDLKDASNRNATKMILNMCPPSLTNWLMRARSPLTILPNGDSVALHMISSMGNAYTFPLQTMLYASVVVACYRVLGIKVKYPRGESLGNFAVFGDDIIVVKQAYDLVCSVLSTLGHIVNHDKSFKTGFFRESCGSDWFAGRDVRGVYIKSLNDACDYYSAINRLNLWSARHGVELSATIRYLTSEAKALLRSQKKGLHLVPMHEVETAGIRVPEDYVRGKLAHSIFGYRYKYLSVANYKVDLSSYESFRLQLKANRKECREKEKRGIQLNAKNIYLEKSWFNASGVLLCAVAGKLRDCSIVVREFGRRTVVKHRRSSCWNYPGAAHTVRCGGPELLFWTGLNLGKL